MDGIFAVAIPCNFWFLAEIFSSLIYSYRGEECRNALCLNGGHDEGNGR